jgi:hypothetical protein
MAHAQHPPAGGKPLTTPQAVPPALSMLLHGLHDFCLLGFHATVSSSAVVRVVWVGIISSARRIEDASRRRRPKR